MSERPLLLLSNYDGVHAEGLSALAAALRRLGEVYVVAPERKPTPLNTPLVYRGEVPPDLPLDRNNRRLTPKR